MSRELPSPERQLTRLSQDQRQRKAKNTLQTKQERTLWLLSTAGWGIILCLGLVLLIQHVIVVSQGPTDFCQDYIAAQRVLDGTPVYQPLRCWAGYVQIPTTLEYDSHPPTSVLFFVPLALLHRIPASLIWGFCSLAAYLITGLFLLQILGWRTLRGVALFVAGSILWEPLTVAETVQNFWEVLTLLLLLAWVQERRGRFAWAGGLVGVAGLIKLWPVILLLGAVIRRRWQLAISGSFILTLGCGLSLLILGPGAFRDYLGPVQTNEGAWVSSGVNVSLVGALVRPFVGYTDPAYTVTPLVPGVRLSNALLLGEAIAGLVLIGTLVFIWWCSRQNTSEAIDLLSQSLLLTVVLLVFPIAWRWGMITILLPITMIILAQRQLKKLSRWQLIGLWLGLVPLLLRQSWMVSLANWLEHYSADLGSAVWGLPTLGLMLFASMQAYLLWQICFRDSDAHSGHSTGSDSFHTSADNLVA